MTLQFMHESSAFAFLKLNMYVLTYAKTSYSCRNFHHLIKVTSSVLMTYWSVDVIVHERKFVINRLTKTRAIMNFLTCTIKSSDQYIISTDEVALIRR